MIDKVTLKALLGDYPNTMALKKGEVSSPLVDFLFADVKVPNTAFKRLVRDQEFDFGELAIVTYLQAKSFGTPYVLLPATVVGRGWTLLEVRSDPPTLEDLFVRLVAPAERQAGAAS